MPYLKLNYIFFMPDHISSQHQILHDLHDLLPKHVTKSWESVRESVKLLPVRGCKMIKDSWLSNDGLSCTAVVMFKGRWFLMDSGNNKRCPAILFKHLLHAEEPGSYKSWPSNTGLLRGDQHHARWRLWMLQGVPVVSACCRSTIGFKTKWHPFTIHVHHLRVSH